MLELARLGINCEPAENDQFAGTERVKTWLHNKQLWFVESRVPRTVKQMMALRYAGARRDGQTREKMEVYKKGSSQRSVQFWSVSMANKSSIVSDLHGWRTPSVSGEELQAPGKSGPQ